MPKLQLVFLLLFILTRYSAYSQDEIKYYHKVWDIVKSNNSNTIILKKTDSLKKTRRPQNSKVEILYNRDIDFGYKQEKIAIRFNGFPYMLNLLLKNDLVIFASADFNANILGTYSQNDEYREVKVDTMLCRQCLNLHNTYYVDNKTIDDLVKELSGVDNYSILCGDGLQETPRSKHIDTLIKKEDVIALDEYLKSLSCEQQAYGIRGFIGLKRAGVRISLLDKKLIKHIIDRNSELIECTGCLINVIGSKKK